MGNSATHNNCTTHYMQPRNRGGRVTRIKPETQDIQQNEKTLHGVQHFRTRMRFGHGGPTTFDVIGRVFFGTVLLPDSWRTRAKRVRIEFVVNMDEEWCIRGFLGPTLGGLFPGKGFLLSLRIGVGFFFFFFKFYLITVLLLL